MCVEYGGAESRHGLPFHKGKPVAQFLHRPRFPSWYPINQIRERLVPCLLAFGRFPLKPQRIVNDIRAAMGDDTGPVAVPGDDALSRLSRAVDSLLAEQREMRAVAQYLDSVSRFLPEAEPAILAAEAPSLAPTPQHITGLWLGA